MSQKAQQKQITIRLESTILERIDRHADRLRALSPGLSIPRVAAIRALILDALGRAEAGLQPPDGDDPARMP